MDSQVKNSFSGRFRNSNRFKIFNRNHRIKFLTVPGVKSLRELNWKDFHFDPKNIDLILLTHAHLDYTGYLPRLVKQGYKNPILGTPPTKIVITASGMVTGGRVLTYLRYLIEKPETTVLLAGYQAEGTRGTRKQGHQK